MTDPMLRKLAKQLVSVDKRVRDLETVPQLAHSSIDDQALPVYDAEGNVVAKIGKQDDGTWGAPPLQGPTPPAPRGVTATGGPGTINVAWTGGYERDAAPLDFDTLEVLIDGELAGAIPNRDGGTVTIAAAEGTRYVSTRVRTLVPRHSSTTSPFSVEVGPPADQLFIEARERIEDAEGDLAGARARIDAALDAEGHIREDEILRNATLLGETVVEQINVADKLIGRDGVFTGTVDFENVNVTGTQIVNTIEANSISADRINGGTFEGKTLIGANIVGARIVAPAAPNYYGGIAINPEYGLRGWDDRGNLTFHLNPQDGSVDIAANLRALDFSNRGLVISPQTGAGNSALYFTSDGSLGGNTAAIWRASYSAGRDPLYLRGGNGAGVTVQNGLYVASGVLSAETAQLSGLTLSSQTKKVAVLPVYDFDAQGLMYNSGMPDSSTASVNVRVGGSSNQFAKVTSSRRYKRDIEDWAPDPGTVLAMQPRRWHHHSPTGNSADDPEVWGVGFIAEEIEELGLTELVVYEDDEDGNPRPDGLNYDRFCAAQQLVLQTQEAEIKELREHIALLEAQIGTK